MPINPTTTQTLTLIPTTPNMLPPVPVFLHVLPDFLVAYFLTATVWTVFLVGVDSCVYGLSAVFAEELWWADEAVYPCGVYFKYV